jgi:hypothetical protein
MCLLVPYPIFCYKGNFQEKWFVVKVIFGKFGPSNCQKPFSL